MNVFHSSPDHNYSLKGPCTGKIFFCKCCTHFYPFNNENKTKYIFLVLVLVVNVKGYLFKAPRVYSWHIFKSKGLECGIF